MSVNEKKISKFYFSRYNKNKKSQNLNLQPIHMKNVDNTINMNETPELKREARKLTPKDPKFRFEALKFRPKDPKFKPEVPKFKTEVTNYTDET